ncbi:hypothetical protein HK405_001491, partial [Cladochytrium tenue]
MAGWLARLWPGATASVAAGGGGGGGASAISSSSSAAYFPDHVPRLQYLELAEMYSPEDPDGRRLLTVALMRRAVVDVQRAVAIREEKPPLQGLVRAGVI